MLSSAYTDVVDFLASAVANIETASLIGGNTQLAADATLGAISLQVNSAAAPFPQSGSFTIWILDGPRSERLTASVTDATHLAVPAGTQAAHSASASVSSAGVAGSLADVILQASATVEYKCAQGPDGGERGLWQQSRVETLSGPGMRAAIDRDKTVRVRPFHFPVVSVASIALQFGAQPSTTLDLTYLTLADGARSIEVPSPLFQTSTPPGYLATGYALPRARGFDVTLTYVGGPIAGTTLDAVPYAMKQATFLLILDRLAKRQNPMGVMSMRRGDVQWAYGGRSSTKAESMLATEAEELLTPYMTPPGW